MNIRYPIYEGVYRILTNFPVIVDVIAIYIILLVLLVYGFPVRFVTGKEKQDETDNRNKD